METMESIFCASLTTVQGNVMSGWQMIAEDHEGGVAKSRRTMIRNPCLIPII